ncbi:MAG TPA: YraN family protein [Blastocatellia bacterium]|nr:YraN family protein [Blastocatellia bacterium]
MGSLMKRLFGRARPAARAPHLALGETGEHKAAGYLKSTGKYRIVAMNFKVLLGRGLGGRKVTAEIDIIAYEGDILVFIEVKTRTTGEIAAPQAAVGLRKQRQIARAARRYRQMMDLMDEPYRYDVVTVVGDPSAGYQIDLLRAYFDDSVFRRARYFSSHNHPS